MRICSGPGCLRPVPNDVRFCSECAVGHVDTKPHGGERARNDEIQTQYTTLRWKKVRYLVLQRSATCAICKRAIVKVVDHIVPSHLIVKVARAESWFPLDPWAAFYIEANLQGVCYACNNVKARAEDSIDWSEQIERLRCKYKQTSMFL